MMRFAKKKFTSMKAQEIAFCSLTQVYFVTYKKKKKYKTNNNIYYIIN